MNEENAVTLLAQWCFAVSSVMAHQFIQGIEHVHVIRHCYELRMGMEKEPVYFILPLRSHEHIVRRLCEENGLVSISHERSGSILADFRQHNQTEWDQLVDIAKR